MYVIEYGEKCSETVSGIDDLIMRLQSVPAKETVADIRKIYKNGSSASVMDIYGKYIRR